MEIGVRAFGIEANRVKLRSLGKAAVHLRPALELVADEMMSVTEKNFRSGGRRGGGSWAADSPDWAYRKMRSGMNPAVLRATDALFRSLTDKNDEEHVRRITDSRVEIGTSVEYAGVHQFGDPAQNIPARPFLRYIAGDMDRFKKIIRDYCLYAYRTAS